MAATKYIIFVGNLCTDRQTWQQVGAALKEFLQLPAEERTRIVMRCCSSLKIAPKLAHTALEFGCQKGLSLAQRSQLLARLGRLGKQAGTEFSKFIKDIQREVAKVGKKPQAQTPEGIEIPVQNTEGLTAFMEGEEVANEAAKLRPATEGKPIVEVAQREEGAAVEGKAAAQGVQAAEDAPKVTEPGQVHEVPTAEGTPFAERIQPCEFTDFAEGMLQEHYSKHVIRRGEWGTNCTMTMEEYLKKTQDLLNSPIGGDIEGFVSKNGYTFRYNKVTNEFATAKPNGTIETLYRPERGLEYWLEQIVKYK